MIFERKYVFETRRTRTRRVLANTAFLAFFCFFTYMSLCGFLILFAQYQNAKTDEALNRQGPDIIAVFTGDGGRISHATQLSKKYNNIPVYITGVYTSNSIQTLVGAGRISQVSEEDLDKFEIDYLAKNTVENVIATLMYLRKKQEYQRVLIISSDYHLARIDLILRKIKSINDPYEFYLNGSRSNLTKWRGIKILCREVIKLVKTYGFLLLWDSETRPALGPSSSQGDDLGPVVMEFDSFGGFSNALDTNHIFHRLYGADRL